MKLHSSGDSHQQYLVLLIRIRIDTKIWLGEQVSGGSRPEKRTPLRRYCASRGRITEGIFCLSPQTPAARGEATRSGKKSICSVMAVALGEISPPSRKLLYLKGPRCIFYARHLWLTP